MFFTTIFTSLLVVSLASAGVVNYQYIRNYPADQGLRTFSRITHPPPNRRGVRAYSTSYSNTLPSLESSPESLWPNGLFMPPDNNINFEYTRNGHKTPDYSNGLEYFDPYLITGEQAKMVANYLYSKELFFGDYPHIRALLKNQELRKENGLDGHKVGSIRRMSPIYRYLPSIYLYN